MTAPLRCVPVIRDRNAISPFPTSQDLQRSTNLDAWVLLVAAIIAASVIALSVLQAQRARTQHEQVTAEAQAFEEAAVARGLEPVPTNAILKRGESAFYEAAAELYETRAVRQFSSGSAGVRVAKGAYLGRTRGTSTSKQEWSQIDSGTLTVSSRRLIFAGMKADRVTQIERIVAVQPMIDAVGLTIEGRQKGMVFKVANPGILTVVIRTYCKDA